MPRLNAHFSYNKFFLFGQVVGLTDTEYEIEILQNWDATNNCGSKAMMSPYSLVLLVPEKYLDTRSVSNARNVISDIQHFHDTLVVLPKNVLL